MLHAQCTSALSSGFPISQGNAEALDRWGGKPKHHIILYFLSNISAKNYRNRIVCVKIIASQRWDVFMRHGVVTLFTTSTKQTVQMQTISWRHSSQDHSLRLHSELQRCCPNGRYTGSWLARRSCISLWRPDCYLDCWCRWRRCCHWWTPARNADCWWPVSTQTTC